MNIYGLIDTIIEREGEYVNHEADMGGATKYGITQDTLTAYRGYPVSENDVEAMTRTEAVSIYVARYIEQPRFDDIDNVALASLIIDSGVNHGVTRAAKWLQQAAGVKVDGMVGAKTLEAVNNQNAGTIYRKVLAERTRFYGRIITNNPTQAVFAAGWTARLSEFIEDMM